MRRNIYSTKIRRPSGLTRAYAKYRRPAFRNRFVSGLKQKDVVMLDKPTVRRNLNFRTGGFLGLEKKFLDSYASSVALTAPSDCSGGEIQPEGGCTGCISAPAQGDGESNRDGRKIVIKNCWVQGTINPVVQQDQGDLITPPLVFVALVLDTQANGATVVSEQVFTNPNDTPLVNARPLRNMEYTNRYRVLAHGTVSLGPATAGTDGANTNTIGAQQRRFQLGWKGNLGVNFINTTADVASVADNALHIVAFSTSTAFAPTISYNARIRFVG